MNIEIFFIMVFNNLEQTWRGYRFTTIVKVIAQHDFMGTVIEGLQIAHSTFKSVGQSHVIIDLELTNKL